MHLPFLLPGLADLSEQVCMLDHEIPRRPLTGKTIAAITETGKQHFIHISYVAHLKLIQKQISTDGNSPTVAILMLTQLSEEY